MGSDSILTGISIVLLISDSGYTDPQMGFKKLHEPKYKFGLKLYCILCNKTKQVTKT